MKFKLNEHLDLPQEGFFWIINNKVYGYGEEVPKYGYEYKQSSTHENTWDILKPRDCDKSYNYYPRGRVFIDPEYDTEGKFKSYSCMVFLDPCIDNDKSKKLIIDYYNLNLPSIENIHWYGNLKGRAGIDHYTCHNCR